MNENTYRYMEITGTSNESIQHAIENAVNVSSEKNKSMRWFEVLQIRGAVESDFVKQWQVTLKIAYDSDHQ